MKKATTYIILLIAMISLLSMNVFAAPPGPLNFLANNTLLYYSMDAATTNGSHIKNLVNNFSSPYLTTRQDFGSSKAIYNNSVFNVTDTTGLATGGWTSNVTFSGNNLTVSLWFYPTSFTTGNLISDDCGAFCGAGLYVTTGGKLWWHDCYMPGSICDDLYSTKNITLNQWNHIVFSAKPTNETFFINNESAGFTANSVVNRNPTNWSILKANFASANGALDYLDEVTLLNTWVNSSTVSLFYGAGPTGFRTEQQYPFEISSLASITPNPLLINYSSINGYCQAPTNGTQFNYSWYKNNTLVVSGTTSGTYVANTNYLINTYSTVIENGATYTFECSFFNGISYTANSNTSLVATNIITGPLTFLQPNTLFYYSMDQNTTNGSHIRNIVNNFSSPYVTNRQNFSSYKAIYNNSVFNITRTSNETTGGWTSNVEYDSTQGTTFSISLWYYPTLISNAANLLSNDCGAWCGLGLYIDASAKLYIHDCFTPFTCNDYTSTGSLTSNQWNHIVVSYNSGTLNFYINNATAGGFFAPLINQANAANWSVLKSNFGSSGGVDGFVDEVVFFNTAVTTNTVSLLYSNGSTGFQVLQQYPYNIIIPNPTPSTTIPGVTTFISPATLYTDTTLQGYCTPTGSSNNMTLAYELRKNGVSVLSNMSNATSEITYNLFNYTLSLSDYGSNYSLYCNVTNDYNSTGFITSQSDKFVNTLLTYNESGFTDNSNYPFFPKANQTIQLSGRASSAQNINVCKLEVNDTSISAANYTDFSNYATLIYTGSATNRVGMKVNFTEDGTFTRACRVTTSSSDRMYIYDALNNTLLGTDTSLTSGCGDFNINVSPSRLYYIQVDLGGATYSYKYSGTESLPYTGTPNGKIKYIAGVIGVAESGITFYDIINVTLTKSAQNNFRTYNTTTLNINGLNINIPFSYYTNQSNSTNPNVNWRLVCNDTQGTSVTSQIHQFTVSFVNLSINVSSNITPNVLYINTTLQGFCAANASDTTNLSLSYILSNGTSTCYQESANTSNQRGNDGNCGLNYNGQVGSSDSGLISGARTGYYYANYTKPNSVINATARFMTYNSSLGPSSWRNLTYNIPTVCMNTNKVELRYGSIYNFTGGVKGITVDCFDQVTQTWNYIYNNIGVYPGSVGVINNLSWLNDGYWDESIIPPNLYGCQMDISNGWQCQNLCSHEACLYEEAVIWGTATSLNNTNGTFLLDKCYQETATVATSCGGLSTGNYNWTNQTLQEYGFLSINYTKPNNAINAIWQVKHGELGSLYNITLPESCFNQNNLQLRILSKDGQFDSTNSWSQPQCFNGNWINVGSNLSGNNFGVSGTGNRIAYTMDGIWSTSAAHQSASLSTFVWMNWNTAVGGDIYEEAIYWSMRPNNGVNYNVLNYTLGLNDYDSSINLYCKADNAWVTTNYRTSIASKHVIDLIEFNLSGFRDNSVPNVFPEVGDTIQLNGSVHSADTINMCFLQTNVTGTWINSQNVTLNINTTGGPNVLTFMNLPFTYTVTNNSRGNNSQVNWRITCNDTFSVDYTSGVAVFNVTDLTFPVIVIPPGGLNINTNNRTVFSRENYNLTYNITYSDYNLFAMEINVSCDLDGQIYYFTNSSLTTQNYTVAGEVPLNNASFQRCNFFTAASDSHTDDEIPEYDVETLDNGLSFLTENNNIVQVISETSPVDNVDTTKLIDRQTFEFEFADTTTTRTFKVLSDKPLYYIEDSKYPAHFVAWNQETFAGNWIDFVDQLNTGDTYVINKVNDYEYDIIITTLQPTSEMRFASIGGTTITNFTLDFYIGGTIYIDSNNSYDGSRIAGFNYQLITTDGINNFTGWINGNGTIQNVSAGNYNITFTNSTFFMETETTALTNSSVNITVNGFQNQYNIIFDNVATSEILYNVSYTIQNVGTGWNRTNVTITSPTVFYLNNGTYNITWLAPGYNTMKNSFSATTLQNITLTLHTNFNVTFILYDEKLSTINGFNVPFNYANATSISFLLFCPGETFATLVNSSTFTTSINCNYDLFTFLLSYGTSSYYRSFILEPDELFNVPIYLIDLTTTPYLFNSIVADDLLNKYTNPRIYVKKTIGNQTVQITANFVDIEQKIGAYLIENSRYIVEIHSDNLPVYVLGNYFSDAAGTKSIRLYQVGLYDSSSGTSTPLTRYVSVSNISGNTTIQYKYADSQNLTTSVSFKVLQDNNPIPVCSDTLIGQNNFNINCDAQSYFENSTVTTEETVCRAGAACQTHSQIIHQDNKIRLPILDYLGPTAVSWFFIILLAVIIIMSSIQTANATSLIMLLVAIALTFWGWTTLSAGILAIAALISLVSNIKESDKLN